MARAFDPWLRAALVAACAAAVAAAVFERAWISEDAFITLRYVANALAGEGAVFNPGERVQGYSHPLWFLLLVAGAAAGPDPILLAIGCGVALAFATIALLGAAIARLAPRLAAAAALLGLLCLICLASDSWLAFQTSGLENALSGLFVAAAGIECVERGTSRPARLTLLLCLACLTRPDLVFLAAPPALLALAGARGARQVAGVLAAGVPALVWIAFAWSYYGDPLPNPARAKLGIYPAWTDAVRQGLRYLEDWLRHEPLSAGGALVLAAAAVVRRPSSPSLALLGGALAYVGWVIAVGGDFIRGRLFLPAFTAFLALGCAGLAASERVGRSRPSRLPAVAAALLLALAALQVAAPDPGARTSDAGIVDERAYYPGYHLGAYLRSGALRNPYRDLTLADALRDYAERCGPVAIHARNPGTIAYLAGPKVAVVDKLGLTDGFIARLPRETQLEALPRPGHADERIPPSYLEGRGVISLYPGWERAVRSGDCAFLRDARARAR